MKISKIKVQNYRLLKKFELDLEEDLSLVIGKNNCGKTSLLSILNKFINDKRSSSRSSFTCDDFNIDFQKHLKQKIEENQDFGDNFLGLSLKLFISYDATDDLSNLSKILMDLDPLNTSTVLAFEYSMSDEDYQKFKTAYNEFKILKTAKIEERYSDAGIITPEELAARQILRDQKKQLIFHDFLKNNHQTYFKLRKKSVLFDLAKGIEDDSNFIDLISEGIQVDKIINLNIIEARRDVSNNDKDKTLSFLSSKYYEKKETNSNDSVAIQQFKETLTDTDSQLDAVYENLFKNIVEKVGTFGGVAQGDSVIKIISTLQHRELLKGNTTVMYDHNNEHSLPEHYNGLGYMNLIGMIFEIEVLLADFRREDRENEKPADINLLFIEEPEAHTHPQMQYVFIKNIKNILQAASKGLKPGDIVFNLQTIITTHSSHITAESNFDDIKYFTRKDKNQVIAKNLKDLEKDYVAAGEDKYYKFLKQYLTLNRAELFFADKAIFIEGDTERILLPAMMKKIDQEYPATPLMSQNISVVEVGAYSHIFEKFINFIDIKSLVITDIDGAKEFTSKDKDGKDVVAIKKCRMVDATSITNASLKFFHNGKSESAHYVSLKLDWKILRKNAKKGSWASNRKGRMLIVYQTAETNDDGQAYHGRSFEDAFFHLNKSLLVTPAYEFNSLTEKHLTKFLAGDIDVYDFADDAVGSKPTLAMEILLNSKTDAENKEFSNWQTPAYLKEGLIWLMKD
ncbi:AAA family ATPase [Dyadobacter pollutisoli]|uniref:ATP-dependent endonuclease n=1 Tax=Dyadobacter pollutisoli TaxID=2910158 RepID=A0A9E8SKD4_9BACT|nr:ATP-dependent endonuclease [Dyadobacter pollutisoli]WAC11868.1 ATP-dependent endonuclease [Dyadobacter pollutisoli]